MSDFSTWLHLTGEWHFGEDEARKGLLTQYTRTYIHTYIHTYVYVLYVHMFECVSLYVCMYVDIYICITGALLLHLPWWHSHLQNFGFRHSDDAKDSGRKSESWLLEIFKQPENEPNIFTFSHLNNFQKISLLSNGPLSLPPKFFHAPISLWSSFLIPQ
jgi:hypothetical protein